MNLLGLVAVLMLCTTAVIIAILLLRYWTVKSSNTTSLEQTKLQYQFLIEQSRPPTPILPPVEDKQVTEALRALRQATENLGIMNDQARYMARKGTSSSKMMLPHHVQAARWIPPTIGVQSFDKDDMAFLFDDR